MENFALVDKCPSSVLCVRRCDGTERVGCLVSRLDVRWVRVGSVGSVCRAGLPPVSSMKI